LKGLLEQIEVNPDYWSNFPIFLDNYQEITEDRTSFAPLDLPNYHSSHPTSALPYQTPDLPDYGTYAQRSFYKDLDNPAAIPPQKLTWEVKPM